MKTQISLATFAKQNEELTLSNNELAKVEGGWVSLVVRGATIAYRAFSSISTPAATATVAGTATVASALIARDAVITSAQIAANATIQASQNAAGATVGAAQITAGRSGGFTGNASSGGYRGGNDDGDVSASAY